MTITPQYTAKLNVGLGLIAETKSLLEIWSKGITNKDLQQAALDSGRFPSITARRLRNIIAECFAPRYIVNNGQPATSIKQLIPSFSSQEINQLFFLFTSRANPILGDFVRQIYWTKYIAGEKSISNDDAKNFVLRSIDDGKVSRRWSDSTIKRVSGYLIGCCSDFGLLEAGRKTSRKIISFRIEPRVAAYLAYDLHFSNVSDNAIMTHDDWQLFGLDRQDVLEEMRRLSLKGFLLIQSAGDMVRVSWKIPTLEALCDVLSQS